METETVDYQPSKNNPSRPTFLTVLCILTFLASAYYFFTSLVGIFITNEFDDSQWESISEQLAESMDGADENTSRIMQSVMDSLATTLAKTVENATSLGLIAMLVALLSAFGAYEMFQMRRRGFNIYVLAKFIGIIFPLIIIGVNIITAIGYGIALIGGLIMVFLYNVNRKHLR